MEQKRYLSRKEGAGSLSEQGFPTSAATLEKLASVGGGPPFRKYGRRVVYERGELLAWAEARARRVTSTSELAPRGAATGGTGEEPGPGATGAGGRNRRARGRRGGGPGRAGGGR
jgi:hypothetical protein